MFQRLWELLLDATRRPAEIIWRPRLETLPGWQRWLLQAARIVHNVARELTQGQLTLRAMSLVYTTLLALVPLLALSFSVLKAFGVHQRFEPVLLNLLAPLGERSDELTTTIIGFVENMRVGVLGSIGLALLIYTVITLVQKIEQSFNYIWRIHHARSLGQRFSDYLSVILIGPLLVIAALGVTATVMSTTVMQRLAEIEPFGSAVVGVSLLMPWITAWATFTFAYAYITNTRVRFLAAAGGGLVAAVLWKSVGFAFAAFAAGSTRFDAIYSSFAIMIMLLIWVYLSWLVLMIGAQVAFYLQNPRFVSREDPDAERPESESELLALAIMHQVARYFMEGKPCTPEILTARLGVPSGRLDPVIDNLLASYLLVQTREDSPGLLPGRDPAELRLGEILDCVRHGRDMPVATTNLPHAVTETHAHIERAISSALGEQTLHDLVRSTAGADKADS